MSPVTRPRIALVFSQFDVSINKNIRKQVDLLAYEELITLVRTPVYKKVAVPVRQKMIQLTYRTDQAMRLLDLDMGTTPSRLF